SMIDRQLTAEQRAAVEIAEQEIAIRNGRLGGAATVAHGTGIGAGAFGADAQRAGTIDPGDRSAPCRPLRKIDDWFADRMAGPVHPARHARGAADLVLRR